ncbi:MAG: hypothetical protein OEM18_04970 [Nitrosopumilus sp.]|jgi:hypothetical protein|nr:hypothetical protein [Nitrosopumilus sp.]MDH3501477.1 hypothetical protein [Nitrosopumilus sp.]
MNFKKLIEQQGLTIFPVGLGGCRTSSVSFDLCDYDITIFDEKPEPDTFVSFEDKLICIHHGSLKETQSKILIQYDQMQIIQDESWELQMFLSKIKEKRLNLFNDFAKNCLIDSLFCCKKCKDGINSSNVFASCWQKCASFYLADAICALNQKNSSPSHMLDMMRKFSKTPVNKNISIINETVGIERATPILLERMLKSTIGFSDLIEKNSHSQIIQQKHDFFVKNSMLSDSYFYLGYINKENFTKIKSTLKRQPDLIHILKIAFDVESDSNLLLHQGDLVQKSCNEILEIISRG